MPHAGQFIELQQEGSPPADRRSPFNSGADQNKVVGPFIFAGIKQAHEPSIVWV